MKTLIREVVAMVSTRKLMTYELCVVIACSATGFQMEKPLAQCNIVISRLYPFTCVMVDDPPSLWLRIIRYLVIRKVLFWPGG